MTEPISWYEQMAAAMKTREKCVSAIERWQAALEEAEQQIATLAQQQSVGRPPVELPVDEEPVNPAQ